MITFLVPAKGLKTVDSCLASILAQGLEEFEIIIIRNGLSRVEFAVCHKDLPRVKELWLAEANKARALNLGLAAARGDIVITVDADTEFCESCAKGAVEHFADQQVQAVSGRLVVDNKADLLGLWQSYEYAKVFLYTRAFFNSHEADYVMSGAFSCFRTEALRSMGGFDITSVGEDMEVTLRLQRCYPKSIVYDREIVCTTQVPSSLFRLLRQRGALDCFIKHSTLLGAISYGWLGTVAFPYFLLFEVLGPVWIIVGCFGLARNQLLLRLSLFYCLYVLVFNLRISFAENADRSVWLKLAESISVTLLALCLQVLLAGVRLVAMLSFPWRRKIW